MGYKDIQIPENKDPKSYNSHERRAEIFKLIITAGHPKMVSRTELGKRYGVTQGLISKDIQKIGLDIVKELGSDAEFITHIVFESTIMDLRRGNNKDKYYAAKLAKEWYEWLQGMGLKKKAPIQIEGRMTQADLFNAFREFEKGEIRNAGSNNTKSTTESGTIEPNIQIQR